jgi:F0F1-type ATP synthase assembly protein I
MNPQPEEDLQQRLQKLEAEINSSSRRKYQPDATQVSFSEQIATWFNSLSGTGKLVAASVGILLGIALLQAALKFVASAISLALLAGLVYFGYKIIVSSSRQGK